MSKVFFLVLPGPGGQDTPCKYHDEIPASIRSKIIFGIRLVGKAAERSCTELMDYYQYTKAWGNLPKSNIEDSDFSTRF